MLNEVMVKQAQRLLVQRAVDGDDVADGQHLLEALVARAANLLLGRLGQRLVVVVDELAVKGLEAAQDSLADAAHADGADRLALEVVLLLGDGRHIPVTALHLLVGRHKVAHQHQDGHDDVLSHGHDVAARHLGHRDAAIGLVGGVEVDVVGADASSDGELELLGLGEALGRQVARVEAAMGGQPVGASGTLDGAGLRSGDDDFGVDELLVKLGVCAVLVRRGDEGVALVLEPLAETELVFGGAEESGNLRRGGAGRRGHALADATQETRGEGIPEGRDRLRGDGRNRRHTRLAAITLLHWQPRVGRREDGRGSGAGGGGMPRGERLRQELGHGRVQTSLQHGELRG